MRMRRASWRPPMYASRVHGVLLCHELDDLAILVPDDVALGAVSISIFIADRRARSRRPREYGDDELPTAHR